MKRLFYILLTLISINVNSQEVFDTVDNGSGPGNGDGEILYTAFQKVNIAINSLNKVVTNVDLDIYVTTTGNDITGDGTVGNPVATIKRAGELAKENADAYYDCKIEIILGAGTFDWDLDTRDIWRQINMLPNSELRFQGATMTVYESGFTPSKISGPHLGYTFTKARTFVENDLVGYFANATYPIGYNSAGTNTSDVYYTSTTGYTSVSEHATIINNTSGDETFLCISFASDEVGEVRFRHIKITSSVDVHLKGTAFLYFQQSNLIECPRVIIGDPDNIAVGYPIKVSFRRTMINASSTSPGLDLRAAGTKVYFLDFVLYNPNNNSGYAMSIDNTSINGFYNNIISANTNTAAIRLGDKANVSASVFTCTNNYSAFFIEYSGVEWVDSRNLSSGTRLDLIGTSDVFYVNSITDVPETFRLVVKELYSDGIIDYFDNIPTSFIRPDRNFYFIAPDTYPEIAISDTVTLTDNTTGSIVVGDTLYNSFIKIEASFSRGDEKANATIMIDPDTEQAWTDWFPANANLGLTINGASLNNNFIELDYTTTSTGTDILMKANYSRTMTTY